jgi:hypothetical protein
MPGFIKPQLVTLQSKAPKGEQWIHEVKYDGYRVQVHVNTRDGTRAPYRSERVEAWLKVKCVTQANSRLSDSLKILQASPRSISASRKARSWFTWARWDRMVWPRLQPNQEATRNRDQSKVETPQAG